jgi:hypothetical protein
MVAFDNHGNWVDVSDGLTVMTVDASHYEDLIEEMKWRHPTKTGFPISTAEQYEQDGVVDKIEVTDYVSQRDILLTRNDLPY